MGVLALVPLGTGAGADPQFVAGSGRARASLFEIIPRTGGFEIPINFGKALTTYRGVSATATSGGLKAPSQDSGGAAAGGDCGGGLQPPGDSGPQPPGGGGTGPPKPPGGNDDDGGIPAPPKRPGGGGNPTAFPWVSTLSVTAGDPDAEQGRSIDQGHFPSGSPITGRLEHQEVQAKATPLARAVTTHGQLAFGPLIEVINGRTEAEAAVLDGKARVAHAVTTMDRLNLLDGLVSLTDVRWEATQRTGDGAAAAGTFSFGSALFGGKPLPAPPTPPVTFPGGSAPQGPDPLVALNTALAPSGLVLVAPQFDQAGGIARVTPLSLRIVDSELGRVVLGPIVANLQPLREPLVDGLLALSCDFGTAVTVADVASSILTGAGGISFDFGGVSATTEGETYDNPFAGGIGADTGFGDTGAGNDSFPDGEVPGLPDAPEPSTAFSAPAPDREVVTGAGTGADLDPAGNDAGPDVADLGAEPSGVGQLPNPDAGRALAGDEIAFADPAGLFSSSQRQPGSKGGRALAVGALALAVVAALAAADAFHLRRASRSIS